jgi:RNA polymerase sigma-70 factor
VTGSNSTEDLVLARACADGDRDAIAAVERLHFANLVATLRRRGFAPDVADDVVASLRERLFFHEPPMIADYAGGGSLRAWLRRIAARAAVRRARRDRLNTGVEAVGDLPALENDPEIAFLQRAFAADVKRAIGAVLDGLDQDDRRLLRRSLLEGESIDVIASETNVHRATAARQLVKLRRRIVTEVHRELGARLGLSSSEITAMGSTFGADLELSLARQLSTKNVVRSKRSARS